MSAFTSRATYAALGGAACSTQQQHRQQQQEHGQVSNNGWAALLAPPDSLQLANMLFVVHAAENKAATLQQLFDM
jgi:hypothetical protein